MDVLPAIFIKLLNKNYSVRNIASLTGKSTKTVQKVKKLLPTSEYYSQLFYFFFIFFLENNRNRKKPLDEYSTVVKASLRSASSGNLQKWYDNFKINK